MSTAPRSRGRRLARMAGIAVLVFLALVAAAAAVNDDARFLLRAGYEEARILVRRRPLDQLIADSTVSEARRVRFAMVLAARAYAVTQLGLEAGKTYTSFVDVGRDTLVLVMSASPRLRLAEHTWWFPIVGAVPYHGYFSLAAARRDAAKLEARGLDTYIRPAGAFSTLGWFGDPLFSTALSRDSGQLAETVFHELTHNSVWVPGSGAFNESFAMFVGYRGAEQFFHAQGDTAIARRKAEEWEDEKRLDAFYASLARVLDSVYASSDDAARKEAGRAEAFDAARRSLLAMAPLLKQYPVDWLLSQPMNNATVVAARVYRTKLALFDRALEAKNGDLRATIAAIIAETRRDRKADPYDAVERMLAEGARPLAVTSGGVPAIPRGGSSPPGGRSPSRPPA